MGYRDHLRGAAVAACFAGCAGLCATAAADTIAVDDAIMVKEATLAAPKRGMTMSEVSIKFGTPVAKVPAVGNPPISRWEYPGFIVYFEHEHVIHSVIANS